MKAKHDDKAGTEDDVAISLNKGETEVEEVVVNIEMGTNGPLAKGRDAVEVAVGTEVGANVTLGKSRDEVEVAVETAVCANVSLDKS
jgi:hypothetical protein